MGTPDAAFRRRLLTEALTVVAAPAPAQTAWLERHGVVADEIALDLDGRRVGPAREIARRVLAREGGDASVLPDIRVIR
ncbi:MULTISPECIES: hypothetical protein [unclassified Streptomyces]|uniref:hypothetical protein n=1 Tax=unclassified Streptomyces TaxID=2593676 RepID=UPI00332E98B1